MMGRDWQDRTALRTDCLTPEVDVTVADIFFQAGKLDACSGADSPQLQEVNVPDDESDVEATFF